ncbi:MAG: phosphoglucosamine mutase, partial [Spirochaetota bacterium]|nr:phosphoglucosamine mutase [Spirochaetota bacterium]
QTSNTVAIGMDSRSSGAMLRHAIIATLMAAGITPLDLGIVPTPTVLFTVRQEKLAGGLIITASHNPVQWNGLKFVSPEGRFLNQTEWDQVEKNCHKKQFTFAKHNGLGQYRSVGNPGDNHVKACLSLIDTEKIKKQNFKVALDPVNGAGCVLAKSLLNSLGCEVIAIYDDPSREFQRGAEPIPENLGDLKDLVIKNNCHIGFALDPDADRLALVSDEGVAIGEEYTLALSVKAYLSQNKSDIACNISTSRMIDDIAGEFGVRVHRSAVGEINVVEAMTKYGCHIGGEGNGGVIIPGVNSGRDSLVAITMILKALADSGKSLSQLTQEISRYHFIKDKMTVGDISIQDLYTKIKTTYANESISDIDGIKIDFENAWVQVRESNTEPIIRIFAEAKSLSEAKDKVDEFKKLCQSVVDSL